MKDGIPISDVEIASNQACIDLLDLKPNGIFHLLDTQCKTPNASEAAFIKAINDMHAKSAFLSKPRQAKPSRAARPQRS